MSMYILGTPSSTLNSCNTPIWFSFGSTLSNQPDFEFITTVWGWENQNGSAWITDTYRFLGRFKYPPRQDGVGPFTPHRALRSVLRHEPSPFIVDVTNVAYNTSLPHEGSFQWYDLTYGYQYNPGLTFSDIGASGSTVVFSFGTTQSAAKFKTGDIIKADMDDKSINFYYNGTHSVTGVSTYYVFTTTPVGVDVTNESGTIIQIRRETEGALSNKLTTYTTPWIAFSGVKEYNEPTKNWNEYKMSSTPGNFLTDWASDTQKCKIDEWRTLDFYADLELGWRPNQYVFKTYDSNNALIRTGTYSTADAAKRRQRVAAGAKNISTAMGLSPTELASLDNWTIEIWGRTASSGAATNRISEVYKIRRDYTCTPYQETRLTFKNTLGGWDFYNFQMKRKEEVTVDKKNWKRPLEWNYSVGDREEGHFSIKAKERWTLSTDYITESEAVIIEKMLLSESVFIVSGDTQSLPILITNSGWTRKKTINGDLIQYDINIEFSYEKGSQMI